MDNNLETSRRQEIARLNEEERQKLLQRIQKQEQEEQIKETTSHSKTLCSSATALFSRLKDTVGHFLIRQKEEEIEGDFTHRKTEEDFPVSEPIVVNTKTEEGEPPLVNGSKEETSPVLGVSLTSTDKFAYLCFKALHEEETEQLRDVLNRLYPKETDTKEDCFVVLLHPCRLNSNALQELCEKVKTEAKVEVVSSFLSSNEHKKPQDILHEACLICLDRYQSFYRRKREQEPYTPQDLQKLTETLTRELEGNIAEQIRRQYDQQLEESGDIYEDEITPVKTSEEMSLEEYESYLTPEQRRMKQEARQKYINDDIFIDQVLHNVRKHNTIDDPLYLIAIASVDMNTLVILEDITDFEELCESQNLQLFQCSYIYAVSKSGGHWYGNNNATKEIEDLFNFLSDMIVMNGGIFRKELLYAIPNINIFKDIYFQ